MPRLVIAIPTLPATLREGAFSSGIGASARRTKLEDGG